MLHGKPDTLLVAIVATFLLAREFALFANELLLALAMGLGVGNGITVTVCIEILNAYIKTNHATIVGDRDVIRLNAKRNIELPTCRHGNSCVKNTPIKIFKTLILNKPNFGDSDFAIYDTNAVALIPCSI